MDPRLVNALAFIAQRRRNPLSKRTFDATHPDTFRELYAAGLIYDWRGPDHMFLIGITEKGRAELAWHTM